MSLISFDGSRSQTTFNETKNQVSHESYRVESIRQDQTSRDDHDSTLCLPIRLDRSSQILINEDFSEQASSCKLVMELSKLERLNNIQDEVCSILEENVELRKMNLNLKVQLDLLREREKRNLANARRLEKIVDNISSLLRDQK